MKTILFLFSVLSLLLLGTACNNGTGPQPETPRTAEQLVHDSIAYLTKTAQPGDLVLRQGGDLISYQIKFLSQKDQSFSHAGIIVERNGQKMVCNIYPDSPTSDTVKYEPVDTFLDPNRNLGAGLYRYDLSPAERTAFLANLDDYAQKKARFDKRYDLSTDSLIYCSEMIYKSLHKATAGRVDCQPIFPPANMQSLLMAYFKKDNPTHDDIAKRPFIPIDHLYLMPQCHVITRFSLKTTP